MWLVVSLREEKDFVMNVSLTPHFNDFIQQKVKSGQYHSASEVIRAALRLLEEREAAQQAHIEYMRDEIQKGIDSGPSTEWNLEETLAKAHARMDASKYNI